MTICSLSTCLNTSRTAATSRGVIKVGPDGFLGFCFVSLSGLLSLSLSLSLLVFCLGWKLITGLWVLLVWFKKGGKQEVNLTGVLMRVATCEQPCERKKLTAFIRVYSADRCVFDEKKAKKKKAASPAGEAICHMMDREKSVAVATLSHYVFCDDVSSCLSCRWPQPRIPQSPQPRVWAGFPSRGGLPVRHQVLQPVLRRTQRRGSRGIWEPGGQKLPGQYPTCRPGPEPEDRDHPLPWALHPWLPAEPPPEH